MQTQLIFCVCKQKMLCPKYFVSHLKFLQVSEIYVSVIYVSEIYNVRNYLRQLQTSGEKYEDLSYKA